MPWERIFLARRYEVAWYPLLLEAEFAKVARIAKKRELDFAEEARSWPGIWVGTKLPRNGDYLLALSDAARNGLEPQMLVDKG